MPGLNPDSKDAPKLSEHSSVIHCGQNLVEPEIGHPGSGFHHTSTYQLPYVDELTEESYDQKNEDYGRQGHRYCQILENQISALEGAKHVVAYGSGIAAISAICMTLKSGDLILAEENTYGSTVRLWRDELEKFGVRVVYADLAQDENIGVIEREKPQLVWMESPTNPMLKVIDIAKVARAAKNTGAISVVDNSFASSWLQKPLALGADLSVISLTKYSDGHASSMGGAVSTNLDDWGERMFFQRKTIGLHLAPDEAERIAQGLRTIAIRMEKHCQNALAVAQHLEKNELVSAVVYPFLPSHPRYELAKKQMSGGSGIVTFDLKIEEEKIQQFLRDLYPMFKKTHSLGAVASSVSVPGTMSHASLSEEQRKSMRISATTIRFSIGIEPIEDILNQIDYALKRAAECKSRVSVQATYGREEDGRKLKATEEDSRRLKKTIKYGENRRTKMTDSKIVYRPDDLAEWDSSTKLGAPGSYPFTRGIYADMYRSRRWTMRQYAGFGTAVETNKRFRYLLANGQTGLSTAFDLPTQMGLDSDDPMAHGEVGKTGVAIDSLQDMEKLFAEIDLGKVSTSMTINSTSSILLAMYRAVGIKQGVDPKVLQGTIQNDILKEYEARNTYIFPPTSSMRLITDIFEFCATELPKWNTISISGYHIREAGATAVQELAFTFANAIEYVQAAKSRGLDVDTIAPQLSFFFVAQMDLFEEVAKFRAARRLWARLMKERFGAKNPKSMMLRFHVQTAGSSLTQQQPDNNIIRTTIEAMAAVLGGAQSLHTNSKDEALSLPSEASALTALRTQQIIAGETGIADVVDPFGGSFYLESLTDKIEDDALTYLKKIEELGGAIKAVETGYIQKEIQDAAYSYHQSVEDKETIVVGVNKFIDEAHEKMDLLRVDPKLEDQQKAELSELRKRRDQTAVDKHLANLLKAANSTENLIPYICNAVEVYATVGEISSTLRKSFGRFRPIATL